MIFDIFFIVGVFIYHVDLHITINKAVEKEIKLSHDRRIQITNEIILENDGLNLDPEIIIKMFKEIESKRWDPPRPYIFGGGLRQLIEYGCEVYN